MQKRTCEQEGATPYTLSVVHGNGKSFVQLRAGELAHEALKRVHSDNVLSARRYAHRFCESHTREELCVTLLSLGILYRVYGGMAARAARCRPLAAVTRLLALLVTLRSQNAAWKLLCNALSAALLPLVFSGTATVSPGGSVSRVSGAVECRPRLTPDGVRELLFLLRASVEHRQEVLLISELWREVATQARADQLSFCRAVCRLEAWFRQASLLKLGMSTRGLASFRLRATREVREDLVLRMKAESEYHWAMVGAVLLNRAYRVRFRDTGHKMVLVPACVRQPGQHGCRAALNDGELQCRHCNIACPVSRVTSDGVRKGFSVRIVRHETADFSERHAEELARCGIGVVGIACVPSVMSGGLKALSAGVAAQCVLLERCNCEHHWGALCGSPAGFDHALLNRMATAQKTAGTETGANQVRTSSAG